MYMYGFSLSFCVKQILEGKVKEEQVAGIRTSTACKSPEDAVKTHYNIYWRGENWTKADVLWLVERLWGRVHQPRLKDPNFEQNISHCLHHPWYSATSMEEAVQYFETHRAWKRKTGMYERNRQLKHMTRFLKDWR